MTDWGHKWQVLAILPIQVAILQLSKENPALAASKGGCEVLEVAAVDHIRINSKFEYKHERIWYIRIFKRPVFAGRSTPNSRPIIFLWEKSVFPFPEISMFFTSDVFKPL